MPRSAALPLALALGVAIALGLAACGGGGARLLPGQTARQITANLDTVKRLAAEGDCFGAEEAARQVGEQIDSLGGVDAKLKQALSQGAARLSEVTASCEERAAEATRPEKAPAEPEEATEKPPKKEKKKLKKEEAEATPPEEEAPQLPPQANGKAKGHEGTGGGEEEVPPTSGGVGPSAPVERE